MVLLNLRTYNINIFKTVLFFQDHNNNNIIQAPN